uniref:Putative serine/threonine-protein kinase (inferred by orthology to a C. elegans protein) n=1 Tax=Strongyloides venezuelensis TaxID=75913 RepID=A0A0K0FKN0_STRVS
MAIVNAYRVHANGNDKKVDLYIKNKSLIGAGNFGCVIDAFIETVDNHIQHVAIKKIRMNKDDISIISRELYFLQLANHPCIVTLLYHYFVETTENVFHCLIFEYLPLDLTKLLETKFNKMLNSIDTMLYSFQLFYGLYYIHSRSVTHRDIKPANLLINDETGTLKLADFGSCIVLQKDEHYNPYQITRFYRPPELLFGAEVYTHKIDIWSSICTMIEMALGHPLFLGKCRADQATKILDALGVPTQEELTSMNVKKINCRNRVAVGIISDNKRHLLTEKMINLIERNLVYNPNQRMETFEIINHPYFSPITQNKNFHREKDKLIPSFIKDFKF